MGNFFKDLWDGVVDIFTWSPIKEVSDWQAPGVEHDRSIESQRQGADQALPVVYGERVVGGVVVHEYVTGDDSEFLHYIVAFCHGPVNAVEEIFLNDRPINDAEYQGYVSYVVKNGTDDQIPVTAAVEWIPNWGPDMQGKNVCYAWIRFLQIKEEQVWRGEPQVTARIRGREVYDWRDGTTKYSKNNALCAVDYLTNPIYGRGLDSARINYDEWTPAANFCDESTTSSVERTVCTVDYNPPQYNPAQTCTTQTVNESFPRYQLDAIINTNSTVFENFKQLLSSFRGSPNRTNGKVGVSVETTGTPLVTFDDSTLIGGVEISTAGLNNRYNRVIVRFPDKNSDNYQTNEAVYPHPDAQLYQDWLLEDNGKELTKELEFNMFATMSNAQQHAEIIAKRSRADKTVKFSARGIARLVLPNDIIGLTVDSYGWANRPLRIVSRRELDNAVFEFEAIEHQNAIYPWSGSSWSEQIGGTTLGTGVQIGAPSNLALAPDPTYANTGVLTWDLVGSAFVRYYDVILQEGAGTVIYERTEYGRAHTVPLLDPGNYSLSVYAVSTIGRRSAEAELAFTLAIPVPPSDLGLIVSNNSIQSVPVLAGLNLGTQFEFDIVEGDGAGHTPNSRIRARTGVFTGLIPSTQYTVFVRTLNALGASAWVSETRTTTANTAELDPVLENAPPFLELADRAENAFYELEIDRRQNEGVGADLIATEASSTIFQWAQIERNGAFAGAIDSLVARIGYCSLNGQPTGDETQGACEASGGAWIEDAPLAESIRATRVEISDGSFATFSAIGQTYQEEDGTLVARGSILTNVNGQVSGFINTNDGTQSSFDIAADIFRVGVIDGAGAFTPKLLLEDVEGVPTLTLRGRLVLEDGFAVNEQSDIQGLDGTDGADGADGSPGAGQYAGEYTGFTTTQSTITSRFTAVTGRAPVFGDIFSQVRTSDGAVLSRYYDSTQWIVPPLLFVDGNLLATGTIAGNRLIANTVIQGPIFRTNNYSAGSAGAEIDGQTGRAEFQDIVARGDIQATSLEAGTAMVDTLNIQNQAVTIPSSAFTSSASGVSTGTGDPETIQSLSFTSSGAPVIVSTSFLYSGNTTGGKGVSVKIYRGGTEVYDSGNTYVAGTNETPFSASIVDNPPAGTVTYSVTITKLQGTGGVLASARSLYTLEAKR